MASDHEWEREGPQFEELLILDGSLDSRTQVDECPKCAAIVRTGNRLRHEAVCWGLDAVSVSAYEQSAAMDGENIRYRLHAIAQVGDYARGFSVECTRELLKESPDALRFLMFKLDTQIMEARKDFSG